MSLSYGIDGQFRGALLSVEVKGLQTTVERLETGLDAIHLLQKVVKDWAVRAQAKALYNVSGNEVTYHGGIFTVNRQTGKLAQSIQVLDNFGGSPLAAYVWASAEYANAVETGQRARYLAQGKLLGKVVPIPVPPGTPGAKQIILRNLAGKISSKPWVIFRKVTEKAGPGHWFMRPQAPRPFMAAAAEKILPGFQASVEAAYARFISEGDNG